MSTNNADFQLSNVFNVKCKVALVTGGGSGIGLMATQALAVNGAKVYIVGRTERKLATVVDIHGANIAGEIIAIVGDISDKDDIRRLVAEIESRETHLDILINNAGIYSASQKPSGLTPAEVKTNLFEPANATFEDWMSVYRTNVASIYFASTAFIPLLSHTPEHFPGHTATVINISSINGLIKESLSHFASNAAKAATIHLTKMLAVEFAALKLPIRVNSIAPGLFPSEITAGGSRSEDMKSELPAGTCSEIAAGRPGNDIDMAGAVLFAATNMYLDGQIVAVDGGYLVKYGTL